MKRWIAYGALTYMLVSLQCILAAGVQEAHALQGGSQSSLHLSSCSLSAHVNLPGKLLRRLGRI